MIFAQLAKFVAKISLCTLSGNDVCSIGKIIFIAYRLVLLKN